MNERITIHPRICHGQPCVAGTRIPVHQVVRRLAHGESMEALLTGFPSITREDVLACLEYAASLTEHFGTDSDAARLRTWDNPADDVFNELLTK